MSRKETQYGFFPSSKGRLMVSCVSSLYDDDKQGNAKAYRPIRREKRSGDSHLSIRLVFTATAPAGAPA